MQFKLSFFAVTIFSHFLLLSFAQGPTILRHGGAVQTVKFSPVDTSLLASAGDTNTIKLWDLQNNTVLTLRGHTGQISSIAFSPDGQLLASGSDDWTFRLWNVRTQQNIATLEHITDRTRSQIKEVAFSHDGQLLATAGQHVKLWEVNTQTEIATLQHDEYVWALAFSPDGQLLAAGDGEGTVKIWNLQERRVIAQLQGDEVRVDALGFSPDGRTLASAGYQGLIKLWSVSDWALLGTLQNSGTTYSLDFFPDGQLLASTGHAAVTLWSVERGESVASLTGHSAWIYGAAFSPDGKTLASSGDDGTVRVENIESYLQTLQQREMVRLIYFLPINRWAQRNIDTKLDILIKDVQQFYAEEMSNHGFGRKTFAFEADATGNAVVHHVNGKFGDAYYNNKTADKVIEEVVSQIDLEKHIYLIVVDISREFINQENTCGVGGGRWIEGETLMRERGGHAIIPASGRCFDGEVGTSVTAHELGHAFGLEHDFRDDAYIMSYGQAPYRLSKCAITWLDASRFFNTDQTAFDEPTMLQMRTSSSYPPNAAIFNLGFEVTDVDGIHQVQLLVPATTEDPASGVKLHSCRDLHTHSSTVTFNAPTLTAHRVNDIALQVIDVYGNITRQDYTLRVDYSLPAQEPADVNNDGIINIVDLTLVASNFGKTGQNSADVNGDGVVNIVDLTLVAGAFGTTAGAPSIWYPNQEIAPISPQVEQWLREARRINLTDPAFQRGILTLEHLLTSLTPKETALLPNYPNPFNPETWIPYQLAEPSGVTVSIYAADGQLVRRLDLGHQPVGMYESRSRAAYWDGRNNLGESVASGVYFYTLTADEFTATRKMLIRK